MLASLIIQGEFTWGRGFTGTAEGRPPPSDSQFLRWKEQPAQKDFFLIESPHCHQVTTASVPPSPSPALLLSAPGAGAEAVTHR